MIITLEMLNNFDACDRALKKFAVRYPDGLDVSGLWGSLELRKRTWTKLLADAWLHQWVGWSISVGLVPARIVADLSWADLSGANLNWADLSGADLSGANLRGANLRNANLRNANLCGTNLCGADLCEADLSNAHLNWADLSGADLSGANLNWADLSGADLSGANLSEARWNQYTIWPNGFTPPNSGARPY